MFDKLTAGVLRPTARPRRSRLGQFRREARTATWWQDAVGHAVGHAVEHAVGHAVGHAVVHAVVHEAGHVVGHAVRHVVGHAVGHVVGTQEACERHVVGTR